MLGFTNNELNQYSLDMIRTLYHNMASYTGYRIYDISINEYDIQGSASITMSQNGQPINRFYLYPHYQTGRISSIAIYGAYLLDHFNSIRNSGLIFGLKIKEIEMVTTNTQSPFVDVFL